MTKEKEVSNKDILKSIQDLVEGSKVTMEYFAKEYAEMKQDLKVHIKRTEILEDWVKKTDERNQKYLDRFTKNFWASVGVLVTVMGVFEWMNH